MVNFQKLALTLVAGILVTSVVAHAQEKDIPGVENAVADIQEHLTGNVFKLSRNVELKFPDMRFYAD